MFLKKVWDSAEGVPLTYKGINLNKPEGKLVLSLVHRTLINLRFLIENASSTHDEK